MFILLINYVVLSYRRCKGTAVLGGGQIFAGLLSEVVATRAAIGDISPQGDGIVSPVILILVPNRPGGCSRDISSFP